MSENKIGNKTSTFFLYLLNSRKVVYLHVLIKLFCFYSKHLLLNVTLNKFSDDEKLYV